MKLKIHAPDTDLGVEVRRIINEEIRYAGPSWTAASVAIQIVDRLRTENPELLAKWLDIIAPDVIRREVTAVTKGQKADARRASESIMNPVFADAIKRHEEGDTKALAAWTETFYVVNVKNQRKALKDMDQDDLLYAASDYTARSRSNAMQAAFLRVLADRVGARTVGEVFDNEELSRLWNSIT